MNMAIYYETKGVAHPIGFKIYYGDGTIISKFGTVKQMLQTLKGAPDQNMQIIMIFEQTFDELGRPTRVMICGKDYYYYDSNLQVFAATNDLADIAVNDKVYYGLWMTDEDYATLVSVAIEDYAMV